VRLELRGVTKRFPGVLANDHVDLTVEPGEIHALLGENGAGKTTLMNILYGLYHADEGEIRIEEAPVTFDSPGDAIAAGLGMVHQHFMLVPVFSVAENIMLGTESTTRFGFLDRGAASKRIEEISRKHGLEIPVDAVVEDLPVGVQQRVEIVKALYRDAEVLILDEPTAVLTPQETEDLFEVMRSLKEAGTSIIFITHKLKEVLAVADRITVMRLGRVVGDADPKTSTDVDLASAVEARKAAPHRYVTKAMREVEFHEPVFLGDIVSFYTETLRIGRTSITVKVSVEAERWGAGRGEKVKVTEAEVVLVAVDERGRPRPIREGIEA